MRTNWGIVALSTAIAVFTGCAAAQASDSIIGTWKLNVEKSRVFGAPARSQTIKFEPTGNGLKHTLEGIAANGSPVAIEWTANYDGKDYPIKGNPNADTLSMKRPNANTLVQTNKKAGQVVTRLTREVSGERMIVTTETYAKSIYEPSGQSAAVRSGDPAIGIWNLLLGKSSSFGPPPRSQTTRYEALGKEIKVSVDGVNAAGAPIKTEYTAAYDGRDYAVRGTPFVDAVALRRVDARTILGVFKKDGDVRQKSLRTISSDAKTMTVSSTFYSVAVYDRQ